MKKEFFCQKKMKKEFYIQIVLVKRQLMGYRLVGLLDPTNENYFSYSPQ
jgi:hypothetical protein